MIQDLSFNQKIISMSLTSELKGGNFLSADNLLGAEVTGFVKQKFGTSPQGKRNSKARHLNFLLSYLQDGQNFFVSLFLVDGECASINSDIAIILAQSVDNLDTVNEATAFEEGDTTPPAIRGAKTPCFTSPIKAEDPTKKIVVGGNHEMTYEELTNSKDSCYYPESTKRNQKGLLSAFSQLATSEMQAEIVKPRKMSNKSSSASTPSKKSSSKTTKRQLLSHAHASSASIQIPACSGDITLKVIVKHHKSFLKHFKQMLTKVVIENHLY